jgi:hypothetical protein
MLRKRKKQNSAPKNKYGVSDVTKRTEDGIVFDSRLECRVYIFLRDHIGKENFDLQPKFELQPKFRDKDGKAIRTISYHADFLVKDGDRELVLDAKGMVTPVYKIKEKIFKYRYDKRIYIIKNNKDMNNFLDKLEHIKLKL